MRIADTDEDGPLAPAVSRRDRVALALLTLGFFALYAVLGLQRLHGFAPRSVDLGFYIQMLWSLAHGMPPMSLADGAHPLTLHVMPVLAPLAPLARLAPPGDLLVLAHAAAIALALPAGFRLGGWPGVALVALCPVSTAQANFDVHPDAWAMAPMLLALGYERESRARPAIIAWVVAFCCRESLPLLGLAAAAIHLRRDRRYALRLGGLSLAWGLVALAIMLATGRGPTGSVAAHVGSGSLLSHALSLRTLRAALVWIASAGLLAPLAPRVAAPALLVLAMNAASAVPTTLWVTSHYAVPAFPFLLAGTVAALRAEGLSRRARRARLAAALASVAAAYVLAGDGPGARNFVLDERPPPARRAEFARLAAVPPAAPVAASLPFQPALAARPVLLGDREPRPGLHAVLLAPVDPRESLASFRARVARWLEADPALGVGDAAGSAVRLERGRDRRTVPLAQGWLLSAPRAVSREPDREGVCLGFSVPLEGAPAGDVAVAVRAPGGIALAFPGQGRWVAGIGVAGDHVPVQLCGPADRLRGEALAWRWVRDPAGRPRPAGPWVPLAAP